MCFGCQIEIWNFDIFSKSFVQTQSSGDPYSFIKYRGWPEKIVLNQTLTNHQSTCIQKPDSFFFPGKVSPPTGQWWSGTTGWTLCWDTTDLTDGSQPPAPQTPRRKPQTSSSCVRPSRRRGWGWGPGLDTNSIFFCFLFVKKSLICLEGKSMTPHRGNIILFRSSQQLTRFRLGPLKGF